MAVGYYPDTLYEALQLRRDLTDTLPVAGGTDAMVSKKSASNIIFLNQMKELQEVRLQNRTEDGVLTIGAAAVYTELLSNDLVPEILKKAVGRIASPAVRNAGTVGGNICNASPAGDTLPVLYALSAVIVTASLSEQDELQIRRMPVEEFILGVRRTALKEKELVTAVEIPVSSYEGMTRIYYEKVGARQADAISKLSFAGLMKAEDNVIRDIRTAFGSVYTTVVRRRELEAGLIGKTLRELGELKQEIADSYGEYIRPIDDQRSTAAYRKKVCMNLLKDFLSV